MRADDNSSSDFKTAYHAQVLHANTDFQSLVLIT
jgi:hypothetical protein